MPMLSDRDSLSPATRADLQVVVLNSARTYQNSTNGGGCDRYASAAWLARVLHAASKIQLFLRFSPCGAQTQRWIAFELTLEV